MDLFVPIIFAILTVGAFASYWAWRLTKRWPVALRLLVISLVIAFTITPSALVGHGFAIVPVIFVLIDSIGSKNGRDFYEGVVLPVAVVGGAVYVISAIVALVRYFVVRGKDKHVA